MSASDQPIVHTPGPWEVFGIIGKPGLMHVRACVGVDRVGRKQYQEVPVNQADARLIAAAPEMLAAIQGALRIENLWRPCGDWPEEHWEEAKALYMMLSLFEEIVHKVV